MTCPAAAAWVSLAFDEPSPDVRESLLRHAEACDDCRRELAGALAARESPDALPPALRARTLAALKPQARRWPLAAAASLLLAAGAFWLLRPALKGGPPSQDGRAPSQTAPTTNPFPAGDRFLGIARSGSLAVRQGSRVRVSGNRADLEAGTLLVTARGEPVEVGCAGRVLRMTEGEALLELEAPPGGLAGCLGLREALGDEAPALRAWLLSGKAVLLVGGRQEALSGKDAIRVSGGTLTRESVPPAWTPSWTREAGLPATIRDGVLDLGPRQGDYTWEAVLRRRTPEASVAVQFAAGGQGWRLPLGERLLGAPDAWVRVAVEVRRGWVRMDVGGCEIAACPVGALKNQMEPAEVSAPGLRAWGGDVEIREARWR